MRPTLRRIGYRDRVDQGAGVGLTRCSEHGVDGTRLDDGARLQHYHPVGDLMHHRQVVADEQAREPQVVLDLGEQCQDVGLHRHVECTGGFVGDEQSRPQCQRAGQRDPLPLSTGQLVREAIRERGGQVDRGEEFGNPRAPLRGGPDGVDVERLPDTGGDGQQRVKRRRGILLLLSVVVDAGGDVLDLEPGPA